MLTRTARALIALLFTPYAIMMREELRRVAYAVIDVDDTRY